MSELTDATIQTEEALLGAILIESTCDNGYAISKVVQTITPEDFYGYLPQHPMTRQPRHARIFYAMTKSDNPPHQIATVQTMSRLEILQNGDVAHLCILVSLCPCSLDFENYAQALKEYSFQRTGTKRPTYKGAI